jgi:hypothetical protein
MPLVRRRHYSWPFSGPSPNVYSRDGFADSRISKLKFQPGNPFTTTSDNIHHIYPSDDIDAFSAGIIPSSKHARSPRLWRSAGSHVPRTQHGTDQWEEKETVVSTITQANELPTAVLRRLIWPRLEKARHHMFTHHPPSNSLHTSETTRLFVAVITPSPYPPTLSGEDRGAEEGQNAAGSDFEPIRLDLHHTPIIDFRAERHHRRCHSAQPRAWQEPSPGLWTLLEE